MEYRSYFLDYVDPGPCLIIFSGRRCIVENDIEIKKLEARARSGEDDAQEIWDKAINRAIDGYFKNNADKMKVLFFRSNPGYMDVAVFKPLAEQIKRP